MTLNCTDNQWLVILENVSEMKMMGRVWKRCTVTRNLLNPDYCIIEVKNAYVLHVYILYNIQMYKVQGMFQVSNTLKIIYAIIFLNSLFTKITNISSKKKKLKS